jgi:hypothetical protein
MAKAKVYKMWALFNCNRPPIFVNCTRWAARQQGVEWLGGEERFAAAVKEGAITIEKVLVRRVGGTAK